MSYPLVHPDSGSEPSDELKDLMPLSDVLGGTSFVSNSGRVYRLFGNEERAFAVPVIPEFPEILVPAEFTPLSLDEALQQIETFSSVPLSEKRTEQPLPNLPLRTENTTTHQLLRVQEESTAQDQHVGMGIPLKLVNIENVVPSTTLSIKDVVREIAQVLPAVPPKSSEEKRQPLRVVSGGVSGGISERVEEPFVVPFAKSVPPPEETETSDTPLKVVPVYVPLALNSKVLRKCGQHRRKRKALYRKQLSLPPISVSPVSVALASISSAVELPVVHVQEPPVDTSTFRWSIQLDSLMQTAYDQVRMLTDHLVVQQNQGARAMCFKSVFPGDGCSTVLLCAVRALLERNYRVLLIDAHHRHIDLPRQLNLSGNLDTGNEVITIGDQLGLWAWHKSKTVEENTALIAELVATHREKYDFILLDDGSVTESPLMAFAKFWNQVALSGVVLVSNMKRPTEIPISHVARRLRQYHIPLIGIAENYV
ncbi:MAG: hypothetical protein FWE95_05910 [Planctomycetaceae bacterium]|nr:hypothetical protein [Planctomycetaceae bacterium]